MSYHEAARRVHATDAGSDPMAAISREKELKKWRRKTTPDSRKLALIEEMNPKMNPTWIDLDDDICR